jgi:transposase
MSDKPRKLELTPEDIKSLLERVKPVVFESDYEAIKAMADTVEALSQILDQKAASIKRLLNLLFGQKSEKKDKVFNGPEDDADSEGGDNPEDDSGPKDGEKPPKPGHGRNGASAFTGAEREFISHESLKHGDPCPECPRGKVYRLKVPETLIRIKGSPPLTGTVYELEKLRCNLCGQVFTATPPEDMGTQKHDESVAVSIALLKYANGVPFYRLQQFQAMMGVPVPASTQWGIVEPLGLEAKGPYLELLKQSAQGQLFHIDDTTGKILSLMKEGETENGRKGIFTTGVISKMADRQAVLYFTGRNHAGENLKALLENRVSGLSPPQLMCDALSRNSSEDLDVIMANCLTHARRYFVDVAPSFPEECRFVIEILAKVYHNDQIAKDQNMSPEDRLTFHQAESKSLMDELYCWLNKQLDKKLVEPNSGLGKAINYMLNHWKPLTCFLEIPGAPLDNNICERALKKAILHRKNSLFFKTEHGALIGDIFMSLIQTCAMNGENPYNYLLAIHKNPELVKVNPENWLPWNFRQNLNHQPS